ncbi:MAG: serine/threonine protein kinase [Fusobacteria bacterium]|nr:serine/threonine protein kinase [Fusobacteriota bacterium]
MYIYLPKKTKLKQGRYIIKKNLSEKSNMSIVYLAYDTENKRKIVIKEYFPAKYALRDLDHKTLTCRSVSLYKNYEEKKQLFLKEAYVLKILKNNNIVKCYEYFEENNTAYIILEYCKGETLNKYIMQKKQYNIKDFFHNIYIPILDAVDYVHSKKYIHRDIKPSNIIVKNNGVPILIDFGSISEIENQFKRDIFLTPGFSPLEFYSQYSKQGRYSDIYSLTAVLYYLLEKDVPKEASKRIFDDILYEFIDKNENYNENLKKILKKNLDLNYKKRDKNISKLKKNLKKIKFQEEK